MTKRRIGSIFATLGLLGSLLALLPGSVAEAQSAAVTVSEGESIQAALDAAAPGTTITVEKGVYEEALVIRTDGITLQGEKGATINPGDATSECEFFGDFDGICIAAAYYLDETGFSQSSETISDVTVSGFTVKNPTGSGIGVVEGENITITGNSVTGAGCDGYYVLFTNNFELSRNKAKKSSQTLGFCSNTTVAESSNGLISRNKFLNGVNAGLAVNDSQKMKIDRNKVVGNCNGIVMIGNSDNEPSKNNKITKNVVSKNNTRCQPFLDFGIEAYAGGVGILAMGGSRIQIKGNKVTKNVVTGEISFLAGGIVVRDNLDFGTGEVSVPIDRVTVSRNKSTGNSVAGAELDLLVATEEGRVKATKNTCGVSAPDPAWCGGK